MQWQQLAVMASSSISSWVQWQQLAVTGSDPRSSWVLWQKAITKRIVEHALEGSWGQGVLGCAIFAGPYNLQDDGHYWVLQINRTPPSYKMALDTSRVLEDCSKVLREAGEDSPSNYGTRSFLKPQESLAVRTHLTEKGVAIAGRRLFLEDMRHYHVIASNHFLPHVIRVLHEIRSSDNVRPKHVVHAWYLPTQAASGSLGV